LFSIIQAAGWPVWPLLLCSVVALALILERLYSLRALRVAPPQLLEEVLTACKTQLPSAESIERIAQHSVLGELLASGLQLRHQDPHCSEEALRFQLESTGRTLAHRLERFLPALATIASAAPLLGLLGTVIGMIEIFGAQTPGSNQPAQLAHGISLALYNTALGLLIAIPTLIAWRYLRTCVDGYVLSLELAGERLAQQLLRLPAKR
jgi:biopolymer transport protein ExbB